MGLMNPLSGEILSMTSIPFIKAQGLGNDFVMISQDPETPELTPELIVKLSDRRRGIGCDQVILFRLPEDGLEPIVYVAYFNADGTPAQACGNGSRALANYLINDLNFQSPLILRTKNADITAEMKGGLISLTFPEPLITTHWDLHSLPVVVGQSHPYQTVDVGNPHLICFVDDLSKIEVTEQGPVLENQPVFLGEGINVSFAQILNRNIIDLRVWERGAGFTGACGTAACATMAAAFKLGLVDDCVDVHQAGGDLLISWMDGVFKMQGPAETVFVGKYSFVFFLTRFH